MNHIRYRGSLPVVPKSMRLDEQRVPLSPDTLREFVSLMAGASATGHSLTEQQLEALAVQTWRLGRRVEGLNESDSGKVKRQLRDSHKRLVAALLEAGVSIEDPVDKPYTDGWLEVEVIAWEDPESPQPEAVHGPWVKQTIRPIVRLHKRLLAKGEIVVADPARG